MWKIRNISLMVIYLYSIDSMSTVSILPNEEIEINSLADYINLEGLIDPSKRLLQLIKT